MRVIETAWGKRVPYLLSAVVLFGVVVVLLLRMSTVLAASTYTVNSIGDDPDDNPGDAVCETATPGECTLRAAIQEVNAGSGGDTINFNIAGSGVHTLTPASCYPDITESVTIDGYTQPGSAANTAMAPAALNGTLTIEIDGSGAGSCSTGILNFTATSDIIVRGLVINRVDGVGIHADNVIDITITGNYIGTNTTGSSASGNADAGVSFNGDTSFTIGGTTAADRNLLSGNNRGIFTNSYNVSNKIIQGNLIGTDATGLVSVPNNGVGIRIKETNGYTIGGTAIGAINVISGNGQFGIEMDGSNEVIQGNYIGVDANGTGSLPNGVGGIYACCGTNNLIGGNTDAARNVISNYGAPYGGIFLGGYTGEIGAYTVQGNYIGIDKNGDVVTGLGNNYGITAHGGLDGSMIGGTGAGEANKIAGNDYGVLLLEDPVEAGTPLNISIISNDIEQNSILGIHLAVDSNQDLVPDSSAPVPNDAGDPDTGPNMFMNFPVINSATKGSGEVTVNYDLDINPAESGATGYDVAFYANSTNAREGAIYLGSDTVPGDVTGQSATLTLPGSVPSDYYITAVTTMTDASADGFGHSSEFSAAVAATAGGGNNGGGGAGSDSTSTSGDLADTGESTHPIVVIATLLITTGLFGSVYITRRRVTS